jgi:hypothetical protein
MGMVTGERLYVRDAARLELIQVPGPEGVRGTELTPEQIEAIKNGE